jgi:hypothetical protein
LNAADSGYQFRSSDPSPGKGRFSRYSAGQARDDVERQTRLTIPRHNSINAYTMGGIARAAGLSPGEFLKLV